MQGFIRISKYAGMRNDLAQAGGGNTSVKLDDQVMLVKSSGFQLADVSENSGYSKIDYRLIVDYFKENLLVDRQSAETAVEQTVLTEDAGNALLTKAQMAGGRASIETFLHAVTGKYTLHSHPTLYSDGKKRRQGNSRRAVSRCGLCALSETRRGACGNVLQNLSGGRGAGNYFSGESRACGEW